MNTTASSDTPFVIVGMSGGVDSSVTALLLQQQGFRVEGLFMKNWNEDDGTEYCTAQTDLDDAARVCDRLGIRLHTVNFAEEYWDNVFSEFLAEYRAGRTPNPDILCNREIKFKVFLQYANMLGADLIATGHYARRVDQDGMTCLAKAIDQNKDQTYFLHAVSGTEFAKTLFPLGGLEKPQVRQLASAHQLATSEKRDSTGICFIGERRFRDFLAQYIPRNPGAIINDQGQVMGEHQGLMYHTIGQRQGLGIGGVKGASEAPWYVAEKKLESNELVVVQGAHHPLLFKRHAITAIPHWINPIEPTQIARCHVKIRYRQAEQPCTLNFISDGRLQITFDEPQRAVTPGQSAVFYQGDICLGGAVIENAYASTPHLQTKQS